MWRNTYKDYKPDSEWTKSQVEPGHGIVGCEMHELNGWGERQHVQEPKREKWLRTFMHLVFKRKRAN